MSKFVWTKMGTESGEELTDIMRRKEEERVAGRGEFWWGIGSSLGPRIDECALELGGIVPIIFSKMLSRAKQIDVAPTAVWRWTMWEDRNGGLHTIPSYAKIISRGDASKEKHYVLVCYSETSIYPQAAA
jgi:hypothetical protein